ncbi:MAG: hypothetical protein HYY13_07040 [Nitrospirae bacterium]|nr:hypothetical protein [Nitrospirota bacterium]
MDKESGKELAKSFLRLGEITYALLIAGPPAAFLLGREAIAARFLVVIAIGFGAGLTCFVLAVTLFKRWK